MAFLDGNLIGQLKEVFKRLEKKVRIVNFVSDENEKSKELEGFLNEFSVVSDKVVIENVDYQIRDIMNIR
jgi:alkyl hydroperoxide reductase subunit AhpF